MSDPRGFTDIGELVAALQHALGLRVTCGSITLNLNESELQSVKTETFQRVAAVKPLDKRHAPRA